MCPTAPFDRFKALVADPCHQFLLFFFLCWCHFFGRGRDGPLFRRGSLKDAGAGAGHGHACPALPGLGGGQPFTRRVGFDAAGPVRCASDARSDGACTLLCGPGSVPRAQRLPSIWAVSSPRTLRRAAETPARDSRDVSCLVRTDRSLISGWARKLWRSLKPNRCQAIFASRSFTKAAPAKTAVPKHHGRV